MQKLSRGYLAFLFYGTIVWYGCSGSPPDQIDLMPAPDVYGDGMLDPLPKNNPFDAIPYDGILFATDRRPATKQDPESYYVSDPGYVLRLGLAQIQFGRKDFTWELAREISLLKSRSDKFPVKISHVEEWGIMERTVPFWIDLDAMSESERPRDASRRFADAVNSQLAASKKKHIYIYVHGYKVTYENPVLVSAELWHFLGYNGAFIAYSWPSTPSSYAYIRDSDTSVGFARNLRLLLEFLAEETDVEEIHVLGYSNGTRLVVRAMEQLALININKPAEEIHRKLRIRNVILVGSDLDRGAFGAYFADGLQNVAKHMTIYVSERDKALGLSRFLTRRSRLGQLWGTKEDAMAPETRRALAGLRDKISFVNVSRTEGADTQNGHGYFRSSPWASSDILMTLYFGLNPDQRGLVEQKDLPVYTFPPDYITRLWNSIEKADPEFAKNYHLFKNNLGRK